VALSKEGLLACRLSEVKEVRVEGLPDSVYIRKLPAGAQFEIEDLAKKHAGNGSLLPVMLRYLELGVCDAEGTRLFADGDGTDLADLPVEVVPALALEIQDFSGMGVAAAEEAGKEPRSPDGGSSP
jgi:hypothetical protein